MKEYSVSPKSLRPALKTATFLGQPLSPGISVFSKAMNSYLVEYLLTISAVRSVEPSSTMIHLDGLTVCDNTDSIVFSIYDSSFLAGVMMTYSVTLTFFIGLQNCAMQVWLERTLYVSLLFGRREIAR